MSVEKLNDFKEGAFYQAMEKLEDFKGPYYITLVDPDVDVIDACNTYEAKVIRFHPHIPDCITVEIYKKTGTLTRDVPIGIFKKEYFPTRSLSLFDYLEKLMNKVMVLQKEIQNQFDLSQEILALAIYEKKREEDVK